MSLTAAPPWLPFTAFRQAEVSTPRNGGWHLDPTTLIANGGCHHPAEIRSSLPRTLTGKPSPKELIAGEQRTSQDHWKPCTNGLAPLNPPDALIRGCEGGTRPPTSIY